MLKLHCSLKDIRRLDGRRGQYRRAPRCAPGAAVSALPMGRPSGRERVLLCLRRGSGAAVDRFFQLARRLAALSLAAAAASSSSSAHILVVKGCEAAQHFDDGTWLTRTARPFGPAVEVGPGVFISKGTVINGVDLGAILEKSCFSRYKVEPDYPPYLWAPNGFPNWMTPIP